MWKHEFNPIFEMAAINDIELYTETLEESQQLHRFLFKSVGLKIRNWIQNFAFDMDIMNQNI